MPPKMPTQPILVSEARARFSELVEQVTAQPGAAVLIGHRHRERAAVLVDAAHYEVLLEHASIPACDSGRVSAVQGSLRSEMTDEEIEALIADVRHDQWAPAHEPLAEDRWPSSP